MDTQDKTPCVRHAAFGAGDSLGVSADVLRRSGSAVCTAPKAAKFKDVTDVLLREAQGERGAGFAGRRLGDPPRYGPVLPSSPAEPRRASGVPADADTPASKSGGQYDGPTGAPVTSVPRTRLEDSSQADFRTYYKSLLSRAVWHR